VRVVGLVAELRRPAAYVARRAVQVGVVAAVLAAGAGCGEDAPPPRTGTIAGHVLAGPTCPTVQPGQECPDVPVVGTVQLVDGDREIARASINADGSYRLQAATGDWTLRIDVGDAIFPTCPETAVVVVADETTVADVSCDTGIR